MATATAARTAPKHRSTAQRVQLLSGGGRASLTPQRPPCRPGHRPQQKTHYAIYRGPLAAVTDDYGNTFRRGELTAVNIHDWQMLSKGEAGGSFVLLTADNCQGR